MVGVSGIVVKRYSTQFKLLIINFKIDYYCFSQEPLRWRNPFLFDLTRRRLLTKTSVAVKAGKRYVVVHQGLHRGGSFLNRLLLCDSIFQEMLDWLASWLAVLAAAQ